MNHQVFVSHSSKDKPIADAIVTHLERNGLRCWVAPRNILPGANWAGSILKAIAEAKVVLLVFSDQTNASQHIRREIERAVHHGILIAPIRINEVMPSDDLEYFLSSSHWMDATKPPFDQHLQQLGEKLGQLLNVAPAEASPVIEMPAPPVHRRRWTKAIFATVAAASLIVIAALYAHGDFARFLMARSDRDSLQAPDEARRKEAADALAEGLKWIGPTGEAIDPARAMQAFSKSAADGNQIAQGWLGACYLYGWGTDKDYDRAMQLLHTGAEAGNDFAMMNIGWMYESGLGVQKGNAQAIKWYRKSAEAGNSHGMVNLGDCYANGKGTQRDDAEALRWFQRSADAADASAMGWLGLFYSEGRGVSKDVQQARRWYIKGAAAGNDWCKKWLAENPG